MVTFRKGCERNHSYQIKSKADRRLHVLSTIIAILVTKRFDLREGQKQKIYSKYRRAERIRGLRQELRALKKKYKRASKEERHPLQELRNILRTRLKSMCNAEWHSGRREEITRKRSSFITDPFGFTRKLLGDKRSVS